MSVVPAHLHRVVAEVDDNAHPGSLAGLLGELLHSLALLQHGLTPLELPAEIVLV
jgi:hypothetical protein